MMTRRFLLSVSIGILSLASAANGQDSNWAFLTNALVAYYPFDGDADDASGNGDNGVVTGARLSGDRFGRANSAYLFDPADMSEIKTQGTYLPAGKSDRTLSVWFRPEIQDQVGSHPIIVGYGGGGNGEDFVFRALYYASGILDLDVDFHNRHHSSKINGVEALKWISKWHHAVIVFEGGLASIFLDGSWQLMLFDPEVDPLQSTVKGPLFIGQMYGQRFTGGIDDIRFYARALSREEVEILHDVESAPYPQVYSSKAMRIDMLTEFGRRYQLRTSKDMKNWVDHGVPFIAQATTQSVFVSVEDFSQYFRLLEVQ